MCTAQLLLWAALAGVGGCLVAFWAGEVEPSPTIDRADDVAGRLGLPVVATLPTGGGMATPLTPAEPPAWVAVAVRCAELTLIGMLLLVIGIVRSSELASQLASDPLTTLIDCCAWWRR